MQKKYRILDNGQDSNSNARDKEYLQSLKASRAARKSSKSNSPSANTRRTTAIKNAAKYQKQYRLGTFEAIRKPWGILSRKPSKRVRAQNRVEQTYYLQNKAEDKDMARRRRLMNAKKNVNKRTR